MRLEGPLAGTDDGNGDGDICGSSSSDSHPVRAPGKGAAIYMPRGTAPKSHNFLIVATRTSNELIRVCLLLFWFAFSPCESKRIRLRTHHHHQHHQHHQINIKWTYRLQLFYATLPSGFSCCVFFSLLPRATRDNCTREGTRPTRTVPASLPHPHPRPALVRGLFVVI